MKLIMKISKKPPGWLKWALHFSIIVNVMLITFALPAQSFNTGDYIAVASGNWNSTNTWNYFNGTEWIAATSYPGQNAGTNDVYIQNSGVTVYNVTLNISIPNKFNSLTISGTNATSRSTLSVGASYTLNTGMVSVTNYGQIVWTANCDLSLPANARLYVTTNGRLYYSGPCNNNRVLVIGTIRYAACNGGGNVVYTFADINNAGGVLSVTTSSSVSSACYTGSPISFTLSGTATGLGSGDVSTTYIWSATSPSGYSFSYTGLNPGTVSVTNAGVYTYRLTGTQYVNGTVYYTTYSEVTVTINPLPQGSIAGNTICSGGTGQLTYTSSSGTGPFTLIINSQTYSNVSSGVALNVNPNPSSTTTYSLSSVTDSKGCIRTTGFTNNSATVTVNPLPQGSLTGSDVCSGGNGYLTWTATAGTGNYTVVVNDGSSNISTSNVVSGTPFQVTTNQTTNKSFTLVSVTGANTCARTTGFTSNSASIIVLSSGLWLGTTSTNWNNALNWCGGVPTSTTDVVIQSTTPNQPRIITADAVCRNLQIDPGASLTFENSFTLNIFGNLTNNGTFSAGTGTVGFTGSTGQTLSGLNTTFYNLTMNNSSGLTLSGVNATASNTLTLTSGRITTGSNVMIVGSAGSAGSISGASSTSFVNGNFRRYIPNSSTPTVTFPVGAATTYAPVSIAFSGTTSGSGYLEMYTSVPGTPPAVASGISQTKYLNRTWTINNSGVSGFTSYSPVFNFISSDIAGSANPSLFIMSRWATNYYPATVSDRTSTSTTASGLTGFGIFYIGESGRTCIIINQGSYSRPLQ